MYDVVVVGAGHAGCEAALAAARMGCKTLLVTMNLDTIALMPCNPSIGGPAKGQVVRELDALGGQMARTIDRTFIQIRMLNTAKGPAVRVPRAQADKRLYMMEMKKTLERQANLDLKQATITGLRHEPRGDAEHGPRPHYRLDTHTGQRYTTRTLIITAGTSLQGRTITGAATQNAGRAGEPPAVGISDQLRDWGLEIGRLKTGTPPRVDARTIDFSETTLQPGSPVPLSFGFYHNGLPEPWLLEPNPIYPVSPPTSWRPQLPCYTIATNPATHAVVLRNLDQAPMFNGSIKARGPRYCPSIEAKIHRFQDKESHGLFLEPEGWETNEVYVQGANTSLPESVQIEMLRTIPALRRAEVMRVGYAVEYDYVPPSQTRVTLECKTMEGLFFAGQINGTSGYEEAAGQGFLAGVNAALKTQGKAPFILRRDQSYIGVMIDDLVTSELEEPYRLLTSRAEYRLLLRQDNADLRLTRLGHELGLIDDERLLAVERKKEQVERELRRLSTLYLRPTNSTERHLQDMALEPLGKNLSALAFLRRPSVGYDVLRALEVHDPAIGAEVGEEVEICAKYQSYIDKQRKEVLRVQKLEGWPIPNDFDYERITGLSNEAKEKLARFQPMTVGQATRIMGVTPADIAILLVHLERRRGGAEVQGAPVSMEAKPGGR